ncbi:MAG: S1C family serine protease [Bythopirellula sp.]
MKSPCFALLVVCLGLPAAAAVPLDIPDDVARVMALRYPRNAEQLRQIEGQVQRVSGQAMPATVGVVVGQGAGSGVIISADGLVLTAGHVIGKADRRAKIVLPDGRKLYGKTLGANHEIDAGMIQLDDPPIDLPFLPVATVPPRNGEWVITLGQPGGTFNDRAPPLRLGRVLESGDDWICTDCTLVGGDSGGPLINLRGEVMAVHSSIGPRIVHNFHIPVLEIRKSWERLLAGDVWGNALAKVVSSELRPLMGIAGHTHNDRCLITEVFRGLPAYEAGVRPGDVIQAVDGEDISTFEDVSRRVIKKRPGQKMQLQIERDGETLDVEVVLAGIRRSAPRGGWDRSEESE